MKGRILITDDEAHLRFSSRVALRRAGYQVEEANNGEEALALINSGKSIDLMVLDLNMPRITGEEVMIRLKGKGAGIPIVAISGLVDRTVAGEILQLGCVAFMEKPFTPDELVHTVDRILVQKARELEGSGMRVPASPAGTHPDVSGAGAS